MSHDQYSHMRQHSVAWMIIVMHMAQLIRRSKLWRCGARSITPATLCHAITTCHTFVIFLMLVCEPSLSGFSMEWYIETVWKSGSGWLFLLVAKGALGCRPMTQGRGGGQGPAGRKKIYYICFKKLFLRPCSNVKHISGTSNTVGPLITYKRSNSAQLNRIFAVFIIIVNVLDKATLFI